MKPTDPRLFALFVLGSGLTRPGGPQKEKMEELHLYEYLYEVHQSPLSPAITCSGRSLVCSYTSTASPKGSPCSSQLAELEGLLALPIALLLGLRENGPEWMGCQVVSF